MYWISASSTLCFPNGYKCLSFDKLTVSDVRLSITFIDKESRQSKVTAFAGDNILQIAQPNNIAIEGACGGTCACSTCHVIVLDQDYYDRIPEPKDDENDMLDLAFDLTERSRLGCQMVMTKELDGVRIRLPSGTKNVQAGQFG